MRVKLLKPVSFGAAKREADMWYVKRTVIRFSIRINAQMLPKVVIVVNADNKVSHYGPFCGLKAIRASSTSNESARDTEAEFLANLTNTGYC